jgi:hypothetical protein
VSYATPLSSRYGAHEAPFKSNVLNGFDLCGIRRHLQVNGYVARDFSANLGCIWVVTMRTEHHDSQFFYELEKRFGARFNYRAEGGKHANNYAGPAWWFNPLNEAGSRWA